MQPNPLKTFIIYARADDGYKQQLLLHLRPLVERGLLSVWHDGAIMPGEQWEKAIENELDASELVLVLVSVHSINSAFIRTKELRTALTRLEAGLSRVVPIVVSPCAWEYDPVIESLQLLPLDGANGVLPVSEWRSADKAWTEVVKQIGDLAKGLHEQRRDADRRAAEAARQADEAERRRRDAEAEQRRLDEERRREKEDAERRRAEAERRAEQEKEQRRQAQVKHDADWWIAQGENTPARYEQFLADHPGSPHVAEARRRLKKLRQAAAPPVPWRRFAGLGGGALALALILAIWLGARAFGPEETAADGAPATDTSSLAHTEKQPSATAPDTSRPAPAVREEPETEPVEAPKKFVFDYPMERVEGGAFTMGDAQGDADECPHRVTVGSFRIGRYEVTQAQWKAVMGNNPSEFKGCDNCPVENVSWNDVQQFIKKLNQLTGERYRLPTEAEWEFAARGGNKTKGYRYAGGNDIDAVAWHSANSGGRTHPVGTRAKNELGLYDMSGNVLEWCQGLYGPYPGCSTPKGEVNSRVFRGGSWGDSKKLADRAYLSSFVQYNFLGFRLARN